MALPVPTGRQREVLVLPARGHVAVLGTAGSGKTTLAILRAAYLADPNTDHSGRTLLVTFNRTLVAYLRHLRERDLADVVVENYHTFARGYLQARGLMQRNAICDPEKRIQLVRDAVAAIAARNSGQAILQRPTDFFSDEIAWISQHGLATADEYEAAERIGHGAARLSRRIRSVVFEFYEEYIRRLALSGKLYDWDNLASAARNAFQSDTTQRLYRHVVIDEGQDFSPEMIRSLAAAVPTDGSLTFFGDMAQQIYGQRISWRSAGLKITKPWEFRDNYRNSKQIAALGLAIASMPYYKDVPDMVAPVAPTAAGPLPTLVSFSVAAAEIDFVVAQAAEAARTSSVAILFRDRADEASVSPKLPRGCVRLHREMSTWQAGPGIRYGTYHSAKGLEFDVVIAPFLRDDRLPDPQFRAAFGEDEAASRDGRLLYVAVTRAKSRLILTHTGACTNLLPLDGALYQRVFR